MSVHHSFPAVRPPPSRFSPSSTHRPPSALMSGQELGEIPGGNAAEKTSVDWLELMVNSAEFKEDAENRWGPNWMELLIECLQPSETVPLNLPQLLETAGEVQDVQHVTASSIFTVLEQENEPEAAVYQDSYGHSGPSTSRPWPQDAVPCPSVHTEDGHTPDPLQDSNLANVGCPSVPFSTHPRSPGLGIPTSSPSFPGPPPAVDHDYPGEAPAVEQTADSEVGPPDTRRIPSRSTRKPTKREPVIRQPLPIDNLPDYDAKASMECPFPGCKESICKSEAMKHARADHSEYTRRGETVQCPVPGCSWTARRRTLKGENYPKHFLTHFEPYTCPFGCGKRLSRIENSNRERHAQTCTALKEARNNAEDSAETAAGSVTNEQPGPSRVAANPPPPLQLRTTTVNSRTRSRAADTNTQDLKAALRGHMNVFRAAPQPLPSAPAPRGRRRGGAPSRGGRTPQVDHVDCSAGPSRAIPSSSSHPASSSNIPDVSQDPQPARSPAGWINPYSGETMEVPPNFVPPSVYPGASRTVDVLSGMYTSPLVPAQATDGDYGSSAAPALDTFFSGTDLLPLNEEGFNALLEAICGSNCLDADQGDDATPAADSPAEDKGKGKQTHEFATTAAANQDPPPSASGSSADKGKRPALPLAGFRAPQATADASGLLAASNGMRRITRSLSRSNSLNGPAAMLGGGAAQPPAPAVPPPPAPRGARGLKRQRSDLDSEDDKEPSRKRKWRE